MDLLKVADYMNKHPVTFNAEMPVEMAVDRLIKCRQTGGPVIDERRKIIGFISEQDCLARMLMSTYHDQQSFKVSDIMQTNVLTVKDYYGIIDVAQTMLKAQPKLYPVVDDDGFLLGIITRSDVLAAIDKELHSHYGKVG
ncbi:CBS domain-containing protein [Alishewanella sp. 16-MA]|uniref:CBS domain-containing protein n=1 Tax=Alishewanella maricola TaxID=2795740 RepID=A0ABS8C5H8_9ALTE|nr:MULTISPECIES: CBS domain-containing protein [Gammaproteobacteria]MDP4946001.1 CBS domain-containing protein [Alishewanella sp.]MCB5227601.1 CBS domain-containing protein [Alishewanella maricola]MCC5451661.1 CBS domain-containing protein [Rheinheimera sp. UJ51]MCF4009721.1 CBS domain-containing protein [Rheinheimera sp. UJ63]MDP5035937.1 CBS domain-containing protein [Alishewanella sp.]